MLETCGVVVLDDFVADRFRLSDSGRLALAGGEGKVFLSHTARRIIDRHIQSRATGPRGRRTPARRAARDAFKALPYSNFSVETRQHCVIGTINCPTSCFTHLHYRWCATGTQNQ
jgi:hypothetical protein